jgi:hypothetical protein
MTARQDAGRVKSDPEHPAPLTFVASTPVIASEVKQSPGKGIERLLPFAPIDRADVMTGDPDPRRPGEPAAVVAMYWYSAELILF